MVKALEISGSLIRILDSLNEAIIIFDTESTILYINPAYTRLLGVKKEKILGRKLSEVEPQAKPLKVLTTQKPIIAEYDAIRSIGKHIILDANCIMQDGEIIGAISTFRDITDIKEFRKKLEPPNPLNYFETAKEDLPAPFKSIIGTNSNFIKAVWFASQVAPSEAPVLLEGESGVGKELFAQAIHNASARSNKPMISVNCAAIPEVLFESELFGYEEGAFTGAKKSGKPGKFELANGGTIFLDEIGELSLSMQSKLLRVLQEGTIERLGGTKTVNVNTRIVSATNRDLAEMVSQGSFRQDLFFRLNVINIKIPALRERLDDLPQLSEIFIKQYNSELKLSMEALNAFYKYPWYGNIRELKNIIYHSVIICKQKQIGIQDLPAHFVESVKKFIEVSEEPVAAQEPVLKSHVHEKEKEVILQTLTKCNNNRTEAMNILGVSRRTFYKKMNKYGLK